MNKAEYDGLVAEAKRGKARAVEAAKRKYRETIEALRLVRSLSARHRRSASEAASPPSRGDIITEVRDAISRAPEVFTVRDVVNTMPPGIDWNPGSVSSALRRLAKLNKVKVLEKGRGKRASKYAKYAASQ